MSRPPKPVSPEDQARMCDFHRQGLGAPRIAAMMPEYHSSRISRLLKKCPEVTNSAAGRDAVVKAYAPLVEVIEPAQKSVSVPTQPQITSAKRDQRPIGHQYHYTPILDSLTIHTPPPNRGYEEKESDDDDYGLNALLYGAVYSPPPQTPPLRTEVIDPFKLFHNMLISNFNSSMISTIGEQVEKINHEFFPNLYPPILEANSPKAELPDKKDKQACCQAAPESASATASPKPSIYEKLLQMIQSQSHDNSASASNDPVKFEKKEIDGDKSTMLSLVPTHELQDVSPSAPTEIAKPAPENAHSVMNVSSPSIEQIRTTDQAQYPTTGEPTRSSATVADAASDRTEPPVANVTSQIPNAPQPLLERAGEPVILNGEMPATSLPLTKTEFSVVSRAPSEPETFSTTNDALINPKESEINDTMLSNLFIGSTGAAAHTSGWTNLIGAPILNAITSEAPSAADQAPAPNEQLPTPDVASEAAICRSNAQNNAGKGWWKVPAIVAVAAGVIALGVWWLKKTQPQLSTPPTSTAPQGYARANGPNGTAMF